MIDSDGGAIDPGSRRVKLTAQLIAGIKASKNNAVLSPIIDNSEQWDDFVPLGGAKPSGGPALTVGRKAR